MANVSAGAVIVIIISFLMVALLFPIAMTNITNGTTGWTGWDTTIETLFTILLPILFIIGVAVHYVPRGGGD